MVKVLLVADRLMNGRNGVQSFLLTMISQLHKKVKFYLACPDKESPFYPGLKEQGVEILYLNSSATVGPVKFLQELRAIIKNNGPFDAVHGHNDFSCGLVTLAAYLDHVPLRISHSHRSDSEPANSSLQLFKRSLWHFVMRRLNNQFGNKHVACSRIAGEYFYRKNNHFITVNNGINLKKFGLAEQSQIDDLRNDLGISQEDFIVGNIAKFAKQKNHDKIIGVFKEVLTINPDSVLVLVSTGYEQDRIKRLCKDLGIDQRVRFLGDRDDVPLLMQLFDVFLLPSIYEGLGIVLIEAQAVGTPCIVSSAVPREADMGLNLVDYTSLSISDRKWSEKVCNSWDKKIRDTKVTHKAIKEKGYSIEDSAQVLLEIYTGADEMDRLAKYAT